MCARPVGELVHKSACLHVKPFFSWFFILPQHERFAAGETEAEGDSHNSGDSSRRLRKVDHGA